MTRPGAQGVTGHVWVVMSEDDESMHGAAATLSYYVSLFTLVLPVWAITPLSWVFVASRVWSGQYAGTTKTMFFLSGWALVEVSTYDT